MNLIKGLRRDIKVAAEVERDTVSLGSLSSTESCHDSGEEDLGEEEEELELDTKQKHSLTIRVQKKILGKTFTKTLIGLIDEDTGIILNTLYQLLKEHTGQPDKAKKIIKYLIRFLIKVGVFFKNNAFNDAEMILFSEFKAKYRTTALTFISFYEVNYTYDRELLVDYFGCVFDLLRNLIKRHISPKSLDRLNVVQDIMKDGSLLDALFDYDNMETGLSRHLGVICCKLKNLIDDEKI
ncbi:hypothetical protein ACHWQZ_G009643 [Mnemiopsis leidyi]